MLVMLDVQQDYFPPMEIIMSALGWQRGVSNIQVPSKSEKGRNVLILSQFCRETELG